MISYPLLGQDIRSGWKLWAGFAAILTVYVALIVGMYDPDITRTMEELLASLPPQMLAAFGFAMEDTTLTGFIASYLFGFLLLVLPLIYEVAAAVRLVASMVEKGSMVYLVGTPNTRGKIIRTQGVFLAGSQGALFLYVGVLGAACAGYFFPGQLDIPAYASLCGGAFCLHLMLGGFSFLASCAFGDTKRALLWGGGIPLAFYLLHMLANMGGRLDILRYATVFSLFDTEALLAGEGLGYVGMGVLAAAGAAEYLAGMILFRKRDLSI